MSFEKPILVAHGGAGFITDQRAGQKNSEIQVAMVKGYERMRQAEREGTEDGVSVALETAVAIVAEMENLPSFNCGYGSVLNENGIVEVDACVMDGKDLRVGGVTALAGFKHPIELSRKVLSHSYACLLAPKGARAFALRHGFTEVDNSTLVSPESLSEYQKWSVNRAKPAANEMSQGGGEVGTVGAVVRDRDGNLAAATSTGGLCGKEQGRIGDSPIVGAGNFADNRTGAVSTTGTGESIMKCLLANNIALTLTTSSPNQAILGCLNRMSDRIGGDGGAICISASGEIGIEWNSDKMSWASLQVGQEEDQPIQVNYGCLRGKNFTTNFKPNHHSLQ